MEFRLNFKLGLVAVIILAVFVTLYYKYIYKRKEYIPVSFDEQIELGFNSDNFNITNNLNDTRQGLNELELREINNLMNTNKISFDQARLKRLERTLNQNNIDESGLPRDPKFVQFK
ncbi:hypothetical protein E3P84_01144 [Wallemia ichthyophaga]|nr:hypothetical protein E3P84_01144 [Wallemia ichthyophaga]TIB42485.1 hypothetical protein E3P83_01180 [Wallemia ichthyophaga]